MEPLFDKRWSAWPASTTLRGNIYGCEHLEWEGCTVASPNCCTRLCTHKGGCVVVMKCLCSSVFTSGLRCGVLCVVGEKRVQTKVPRFLPRQWWCGGLATSKSNAQSPKMRVNHTLGLFRVYMPGAHVWQAHTANRFRWVAVSVPHE